MTPRRGRADAATTVPVILEHATALFLERGYDGTSMQAVADAVGISAPSLYWHFASKQDLCYRILYDLLSHVNSEIESLPTDEPAPTRLRQFVYTHVVASMRYVEQHGDARLLYSFPQLSKKLSPDHQARLRRVTADFIDILRKILVDGEREGHWTLLDPTVVTYAISTMGDFVSSWYRPKGPLTLEQVAEQYAELAVGMARAGVKAPSARR